MSYHYFLAGEERDDGDGDVQPSQTLASPVWGPGLLQGALQADALTPSMIFSPTIFSELVALAINRVAFFLFVCVDYYFRHLHLCHPIVYFSTEPSHEGCSTAGLSHAQLREAVIYILFFQEHFLNLGIKM